MGQIEKVDAALLITLAYISGILIGYVANELSKRRKRK